MSGFQLPAGFKPSSGPSTGGGSGGQGGPSEEERAAQEQRAQQQADMKRNMISAMLSVEARERLSRISLTRPQLAASVEDMLVRMGQQGQIRGQVTDEALKGLLEQASLPLQDSQMLVSSNAQPKPTAQVPPASSRTKSLGGGITIQRKRDDSDSDEYDL